MKTLKTILPTIIAGLLFSCASRQQADDFDEIDIPLDQVPAQVTSAASAAVPGFVAESAELEAADNGGKVYELEGLAGGVRYEIEVTPEGRVVEAEVEK